MKNKLLEEEKFINRPSSPSLVVMNMYGTNITDELAEVVIDSFIRAQKYIRKVAFSGLTSKGMVGTKIKEMSYFILHQKTGEVYL